MQVIIAKIARISATTVSIVDKDSFRNLEENLRFVVCGQDSVISALIPSIKMSASDLWHLKNLMVAFFFVGPTGVGETKVSRQLAHNFSVELIIFDMSEYTYGFMFN